MPTKSHEKAPLTRRQRQERRILTSIAVIAAISLLIGIILGILIGAKCTATNETLESDNALSDCTVYAEDAENYEATPLLFIDDEIITEDLGDFECRAYDACVSCCGKTDGITKSGTKAAAGRTVAVDPSVIPLGSIVLIDGEKYIAEDTGSAVKGNKIDIFFNSHAEALEYGKQTHNVQLVK